MKPYDLLKKYNCSDFGREKDKEIYERYEKKDCVVAYFVGTYLVAFLIKGKDKYFEFVSFNKDFKGGSKNFYKLLRQDVPFLKMEYQTITTEFIIINKKEFERFKSQKILKEL